MQFMQDYNVSFVSYISDFGVIGRIQNNRMTSEVEHLTLQVKWNAVGKLQNVLRNFSLILCLIYFFSPITRA